MNHAFIDDLGNEERTEPISSSPVPSAQEAMSWVEIALAAIVLLASIGIVYTVLTLAWPLIVLAAR